MELTMCKDRVLIRRALKKAETESGLVIVTKDLHERDAGTVLAAGPDAESVERGDRVLYLDQTAQATIVDGERLYVVRQADILAVVEA